MAISAERLSNLIGLIYDCAIDPSAWLPNLETLRLDLDFHNAALEVYALSPASRILGIVTGPTPEFLAAMPRYASEVIQLWGGREQMSRFPLEKPIVGSQVFGREALLASLYYREWCEPQGVFDAVAIPFVVITQGVFGRRRQARRSASRRDEFVPLRRSDLADSFAGWAAAIVSV